MQDDFIEKLNCFVMLETSKICIPFLNAIGLLLSPNTQRHTGFFPIGARHYKFPLRTEAGLNRSVAWVPGHCFFGVLVVAVSD